jgi:hypothetical protein
MIDMIEQINNFENNSINSLNLPKDLKVDNIIPYCINNNYNRVIDYIVVKFDLDITTYELLIEYSYTLEDSFEFVSNIIEFSADSSHDNYIINTFLIEDISSQEEYDDLGFKKGYIDNNITYLILKDYKNQLKAMLNNNILLSNLSSEVKQLPEIKSFIKNKIDNIKDNIDSSDSKDKFMYNVELKQCRDAYLNNIDCELPENNIEDIIQ